jgi:hypothetical protein
MPGSRIQLRRGDSAFWEDENPTLRSGEPGWERDTGRMKIGDGVTPWRELKYFLGGGDSSGGGSTDPDDIPDLVLFYENGKV